MKDEIMIGRALIKLTEQEIDLIIIALKNTEKQTIPGNNDEEWKKPINKLSMDLLNIRRQITSKKSTAASGEKQKPYIVEKIMGEERISE